ncbi:hypothetical protein ABPG77_006001 [Micractinium sp. CCAP 211/92]
MGLQALLFLPLLLAAAPAPAAGAEEPGGGSSLVPDKLERQTGTVAPGNADVYTVKPQEGTNPAITVTLTPLDGDGDADLYCSQGTLNPSPDTADYSSEAIGVNQDVIYIPPVDSVDCGVPIYKCAVLNRGVTRAAVTYRLEVRYTFNETSLSKDEQAAAKELFQRCCGPDAACWDWKLANDRAATEAGVPADKLANHTVVETDLCRIGGVCSAGHLTQLNARGWYMRCPFPGDLFARFPQLRAMYLSWNELSGDLKAVASSLSPLPLEELGLFSNRLSGKLEEMCPLVQQGTLEMLQLGGGNDLSGTVPACLFDQKSALYFLGASSPGGMGGPRLTGALPDAFPAGSHLQMLDVASHNLTGPIPPSLAALPDLLRFVASDNNLTGTIPAFASPDLSVLMLDNNNLTGSVPDSLLHSSTLLRLNVEGNPDLTPPPSSSTSSGGGSTLSAGAIAGICVGAVAAVAAVAGMAVWLSRRRQSRGPRTAASDLKFAKFLDDEEAAAAAEVGSGYVPPAGAPAAFYEATAGPGGPAAAGGVELAGRPSNAGGGGGAA